MESPTVHETQPTRSAKKSWLKPLFIFAALGVVGVFLGFWLASIAAQKPGVPSEIRQQASFPVHTPSRLPSNYQLDETSFSFDDKVLVFQATNGAGGKIAFTEQPKPENFNFDTFYKEQLKEAKNIDGTPFPSVLGKNATDDRTRILSIVTDKTWMIVTTSSPIGEDDLKRIAQGIKEGN